MISKDYSFQLTDEEYNKLSKWWNKNHKGNNKTFGGIGGGLTFHITPTSIGEIVVAECRDKKIILRDLS